MASCSLIDAEALDLAGPPASRSKLQGHCCALSGIYGPDGLAIAELIDEEGIVYADIDLADLIRPKLMHDITGSYNQFGVLSLNVNRSPQRPLFISERPEPTADLRLEPARRLEDQR